MAFTNTPLKCTAGLEYDAAHPFEERLWVFSQIVLRVMQDHSKIRINDLGKFGLCSRRHLGVSLSFVTMPFPSPVRNLLAVHSLRMITSHTFTCLKKRCDMICFLFQLSCSVDSSTEASTIKSLIAFALFLRFAFFR